ncbi:reverse transcriptase domain-containing protein [Tanacetum coccineum]
MANVTSLLTSLCDNFKNSASTSNSGTLPSQTVTNPRQQINAITTRSGKTLEEPSTPLVPTPDISIPSKEPEQNSETSTEKVQNPNLENTAHIPPPEEEESIFMEIPKPKAKKTVNLDPNSPNPNSYQSKLPYPERMKVRENDKPSAQHSRFLKMFKQLRLEIGLKDALVEMPKFNKWLSSLLRNKEKLEEIAITTVNAECSAIIMNKVPEKLEDPGKFLIPCALQELNRTSALADSGASINLLPHSIYKKLELEALTPTRMTLELANRSITHPMGIAEDVVVRVDGFTFLADFVVVNFEPDPRVPIILGRPFLRTAKALIDLSSNVNPLFEENNKDVEIKSSSSSTLTSPEASELEDYLEKDSIPPGIDLPSLRTLEVLIAILFPYFSPKKRTKIKPGILVYHAIHDKNLITLEKNLKENISSGTLLVSKEPSFLLPPAEPPNECLKNAVLNFYQSKKTFPLNVEDVNSFAFIIWNFLPFFTYNKEFPLIFSLRNENFVFDPGILIIQFSWVFFLASKDETSGILQTFIRQIENQLSHRVKIIRSDNGTEFKIRDMLEFCGNRGIKQEYSTARTLQQNGVWICQILQEISQKRTRERMSDQEAKEIKAEAREIMPQPSTAWSLYWNWMAAETPRGLELRVESFDDEKSLGEDASKQGRIDDIDADEEITLVSVHDMNVSAGEEVVEDVVEVINTAKLIIDAAQVSVVGDKVSTASAATTTTSTITIVDDITLDQALEEMKSTKPKKKGAKGKGILIEPVKKKDQILLDEETALNLQVEFDKEERRIREKAKKEQEANIALIETWDDIQAKIDADH